MNKLSYHIIHGSMACFALLFPFLLTSCKLDYENTSAIDPSGAWGSKTMINAYLTDIYGRMMPGWSFTGDGSDEAIEQDPGLMSDYQKGINLSVSNMGINLDYGNIDRINYMLDELSNVSTSVLSKTENDEIRGQALFWRAWQYWSYVKNLGGVPLIMHKQNVDDEQSLYVKRSPTSVCVDTIIADLDNAIQMLPEKWSGNDYGRIDKCVAMAFKGRVLLWYASPLFNRNHDQSRWKSAYDANKAALDECLKAGHALMSQFSEIWLTDGSANTEALMFKRYKYPDSYYSMNQLLPEPLTNGWSCRCLPTLPAILAFPCKDGTSMAIYPKGSAASPLDTVKLKNNESYNQELMETLANGMDDRFYASVSVPGLSFPSDAVPTGQNLWSAYINHNGKYTSMLNTQFNIGFTTTYYGGFFPLKAVTPGTTKTTSTYLGANQYIEIRLAEVYMNLAECANELNQGGHDYKEALQYISLLRQRAGIEKGTGAFGYGLDHYASQTGVRNLLINERLAEFSQEGKRFGDLRRWMRFDIMNDEKYCSNLYFVYKESSASGFDWTKSIADKSTRELFHLEFVRNVKGVEASHYNYTTSHWFYPIGMNTMSKNYSDDASQQNKEWGGTFDPLE